MTDVFMSYSRRNLEFVLKLADALKTHGKEVWFDRTKEPLKGLRPLRSGGTKSSMESLFRDLYKILDTLDNPA